MRRNIDSMHCYLALVVLNYGTAKLRKAMKVMEVMEASEHKFLANVIVLSLHYDRL